MSPPQVVPVKLTSARTLDEMLEAVPLLGECDTLDAVPTLASYDLRAQGWFETFGRWLLVVLLTTALMVVVVWVLVQGGGWLVSAVRLSAGESMNGPGDLLLRLLVFVLVVGLTLLFFYFMG